MSPQQLQLARRFPAHGDDSMRMHARGFKQAYTPGVQKGRWTLPVVHSDGVNRLKPPQQPLADNAKHFQT
jgi:hypothetical protein